MIKKLTITNFKSIKELNITCNRINLFIGQPNTGKSNIIESLGLINWLSSSTHGELNRFVRFESIHNLFYDGIIGNDITIAINNSEDTTYSIKNGNNQLVFSQQKNNLFNMQLTETGR